MEDAPEKEDVPKKVVKQPASTAETPVGVDSPKTPKPKRRWLFVLQLLGGYLIAAWTLLQFLEWFLRRNEISPYWVDFFLWTLLGILPALLYYFYHKDRIDDRRWKWKDGLLFSGNLLILCLVLFFGFRSADLGATTQEITYVDAEGEEQKQTILKQQFRKGVVVYNFSNESADSSTFWLKAGIRKLLVLDLEQDYNFSVSGVAGNRTAAEKIAQTEADDYTVDGAYNITPTGYTITPVVKRMKTGKVLAKRSFSGTDLLGLIDSVSVFVREGVGLSEAQIGETPDLPLRAYTTSSSTALEHYSQGYYWAQLERAVAADSTFALAALEFGVGLYRNEYSKRDTRHYLGLAFRHRGKLPLERRYQLLSYWYLSQGKLAAAEESLQLQLEINPQNAVLNEAMVRVYQKTRQLDKLRSFTEDWISRELTGASGNAFAHAQHLQSRSEVILEGAERALLIYPNNPLITFHVFKAHLIAGNWEEAEKTLRSAEVSMPEYQQQIDLMRGCLNYQREKGAESLVDESLSGTYRLLSNDFTVEVFTLPAHQRALAFQDDNSISLLLTSGKDKATIAYGWYAVDSFKVLRAPTGEASRLVGSSYRGKNAKVRKRTYWRIPQQVVEAETERQLGNFFAALSAYRKALEAFPDHYYLRDLITHLEYIQATPPEVVQKQLASVVGTYQERNFTLENGKLFYKRRDLDENSNNYFPKLELLPMSATHYVTPERLDIRIAFDYRSDGQVANYSELYDQEKNTWAKNGLTDDYKLRDEESVSR